MHLKHGRLVSAAWSVAMGSLLAEWALASAFPLLHAPMRPGDLAPSAPSVTLVKDGKVMAAIVVPDEAGQPGRKPDMKGAGLQRLAAEELQSFIEQSSGARLPIVPSAAFEGGAAIFLGMSDAARTAGFVQPDLAPEAFQVISGKDALAIFGTDQKVGTLIGANGQRVEEPEISMAGQLFGVYDFLERFVGVRFYWPGENGTIVPKHRDLVIPPIHYADWPVMTERTLWALHGFPDSGPDSNLFYQRWRQGNGTGVRLNHTHHGGWGKAYGETHPEYFALKKDGNRAIKTSLGSDLCYANPAVMKQDLENIARFYETRGQWRGPWGDWVMYPRAGHIAFLPSDCFGGCECEACRKINRRRDIQIPALESQTELIHGYNAAIAAEIQKRWPEKWVVAGAYSEYALPPQTVTFPDNVIADLCVMDGIAYHKDPAVWDYWFKVIDQWRNLTGGKPIYIWSYGCWPQESTKAPVHIPRLLVKWHRAAKGRVVGEMICGIIDDTFAMGHLSGYFWAKSMWNPDFDIDAALAEYYRLMYGPAEPAMKEYFELMMNRWENVPWDSAAGRVSGLPVDQLYQKTYPREIRQKLQELEARARGLAGTGTVWRQRVDYVTAAHQEFYKEGDTADRLGRGSVLMIERGAPKAVDGKLDDECWRREGGCFVTRNTGEALPYQSRVMAVYDDRALYVAARFDEPEMAGLVAEAKMQDEASWAEDSFEIFLSPREYPEHYVQMAINTLETLSDGWKPAIAVFKDEKNFKIERRVIREAGAWTIEVKIPYAELECAAPVPGTVWRGNFIWNRGKFSQKGLFAFSPTLGQSNHKTQFFGTLIFTDLDRFREDFGADAGMRWTASVRQGEVSDPDARAQMDLANGVGTLRARMSKSSHLAEILTRPRVTVKKGDQLEIRYRLPRKNQGDWMRLETCFMLEAPGEKPAYGWLADNRKSTSAGMVTFLVDLFAVTRVTAPEASLTSLSLLLSSEGGEENELEIDWVRVSPHTILTVESPAATPPEETAAPDPGPRAVQP